MTMEQHGDASTDTRALTVLEHPMGLSPYYDGDSPLYWETALGIWQRTKLQSENTRKTYGHAVRRFFAVEGVPPTLDALSIATLDGYAGALRYRTERECPPTARLAPDTVNTRLAALRSFLRFCHKRGWLPAALTVDVLKDTLEDVRAVVQRPYQIVQGSEWDALLAAALADPYDAPRAYAFVAVALGAGLRVSELCALSVGDVHQDGDGAFIDVRVGKGKKDRQVPIAPTVLHAIAAYLEATGRSLYHSMWSETALFLTYGSNTKRLQMRQAQRLVASIAKRATAAGALPDGKRLSPHALRHSYALRVLLGGAPVPALSKLLGHTNLNTTMRYTNHFERRDLARYAPEVTAMSSSSEPEQPDDK